MDLPILDISYKWNYITCGLLCRLLSPSKMFSRIIPVVACISAPVLFNHWIIFHCMDNTHLVYPFIRRWIFGLFPFFCIMNNAAMNICFWVDICFHFSWVYIPRAETTGPYGKSRLKFLRNCQNAFQSSCTILYSHQHCMKVPISPPPHQYLSLCLLF